MSLQLEQPSVSIAMATFNGQRFLAEQLGSLAHQTYAPHELVIVDDCSTDATIAIVERFADSVQFPVRILRNERPLGHGPTFFRALALCESDLIAFCDQDDVWSDNKVATCVAVFVQHPGVALLVHAGRVVDQDLRPTPVRVPSVRRSRVVAGDRLSPWFVERGFAVMIPGWLRDVADLAQRPRAFGRVEDRLMDHDEWACFLAPAVGSVAFVADELVAHRRHGENFSVMEASGLPVPGPLRRVRGGKANLTVLRPALGGDQGVSGLFDVDTKVRGYATLARQCREAGLFLDRAGASLDEPAHPGRRDGLQRRAVLYKRAASVLDERAHAVGSARSHAARLAAVGRLALNRGYGRRSRGGIGPFSFALDVAVALAGGPGQPGAE